jgi:hypothetical protein
MLVGKRVKHIAASDYEGVVVHVGGPVTQPVDDGGHLAFLLLVLLDTGELWTGPAGYVRVLP